MNSYISALKEVFAEIFHQRRQDAVVWKGGSCLKKNAENKKPMALGGFIKIAFAAFVIYAVVNIVSVQVTLADKREQLAALEEKKAQIELQNEEYERLLSIENESDYMEQYAIEELDYAYPNEIRFYDTSRG